MTHFDLAAPKKAINLNLNSDLLRQIKGLNINVSQKVEQYLAELLRESKRQQWLDENKDAIAAYNQQVAEEGLPLAEYRMF